MYKRIKAKHLMFSESPEEREIRVDAEHVALAKGKMTGHQFEPLFEASVTELETVGLGKSKRELYLSYLRKMPAHLQKEIRSDKRLGGRAARSHSSGDCECCLLHGDGEATATSEEGAKETEGAKGAVWRPQKARTARSCVSTTGIMEPVRGETSATTPTTRSFGKRRWRRRSSTRRADQFSRLRAKERARGTRKGKVREPKRKRRF